MKKCLVCGWEGEPPEFTCPCCGEFSWSESEDKPEETKPKAPKPKKAEKV